MTRETDSDTTAATSAPAWIRLRRGARLFARQSFPSERPPAGAAALRLASSQLFPAEREGAVVVRRGRLRVTEFLPDGREICRAVLQSGSYLLVSAAPPVDDDGRGILSLERCVLMALGETELWLLPPGALQEDR